MRRTGFTLIELLVVIAIIGFLATLAMPSLMRFVAKSKRTEAYLMLRSLHMAEKTYHMEHGTYTTQLTGPKDALGWKPDTTHLYTYGFPGQEGGSCIVGTLKTPGSALQGAGISAQGFIIAAAGDIDNDGDPDVITIDQTGTIRIIKDDLAQ